MRLWKPSGILKDEHPRMLNINTVPVRGWESSGRIFTFTIIDNYPPASEYRQKQWNIRRNRSTGQITDYP